MKIHPHIVFNGSCRAAFEFYQRCLNGKIVTMITYGDSPMAGQTAPELRANILHATLVVDDRVIFGSDVAEDHYRPPQGFHLTVGTSDPNEAERLFRDLSEGGKVDMPLQQTFWALRFGVLTDRFGISWEVNCEGAK